MSIGNKSMKEIASDVFDSGIISGNDRKNSIDWLTSILSAIDIRARDECSKKTEHDMNQAIAERDVFEDFIGELAYELGCDREWNNVHCHTDCIQELIKAKIDRDTDEAINLWGRDDESCSKCRFKRELLDSMRTLSSGLRLEMRATSELGIRVLITGPTPLEPLMGKLVSAAVTDELARWYEKATVIGVLDHLMEQLTNANHHGAVEMIKEWAESKAPRR